MRIFPERPVLKLFLINGIMGGSLGVLLATAFVFGNFFGLREIMASSIGVPAGWALLAYVFACTFAGLAMATAIMLHWGEDDDDSDGGLTSRATEAMHLEPVPIRVRARR